MKVCLYLFIFSVSCGASTRVKYHNWNNLIKGEWKLAVLDQVNYPIISFGKNKEATFNSLADTIYYYSYSIRKDELILSDGTNGKKYNKILELTQDSLIFETLLEKNFSQHYVRVKGK